MGRIGEPLDQYDFYYEIVNQNLEQLSDRKMQETLWLSDGKDGTLVGSFVEAHSGLFDDSGLGFALEKEADTINPDAIPLLESLGKKLRAFNDRRDPQEVIDDPDMEVIRDLSAQLLKIGIEKVQ